MISKDLKKLLTDVFNSGKRISVLTGAGVSAESGIPTFRGPEGYWTIGSENFQPQEISTNAMLQKNPLEVWKWFLFRRGVCRAAKPNEGHLALVEMENILGDRFTLITQNIDGLHLRAGNTTDRTFQIHGNLNYMRCTKPCSNKLHFIPDKFPSIQRGENPTASDWEMLKCPECGADTRPHALLWDEYYNEEWYRWKSSMTIANNTELLIVVGTTGSTNLPNQIANMVMGNNKTIIDINIVENLFSNMAINSVNGFLLKQPSSKALPDIVKVWKEIAK